MGEWYSSPYPDWFQLKVVSPELLLPQIRPRHAALLVVRVRHTYTAETLQVRKSHLLSVTSEYTLELWLQYIGGMSTRTK